MIRHMCLCILTQKSHKSTKCPLPFATYTVEAGSFPEPRTLIFSVRLETSKSHDLPVSAPLRAGVTALHREPGLFRGCWNLNSGSWLHSTLHCWVLGSEL